MQKMTLAEVRKFSGVTLTQAEAKKIIGNQALNFVKNMEMALQMMTRLNTQNDWIRLQAAKMVLRKGGR